MTIDLTSQRAWVYRGETLIGLSTISSGTTGYETPAGSFTILQKNLTHKSNIYDDAPMPFMQRLTWDGVALHAGAIPGHPASHGCVRLPKGFAKLLYGATQARHDGDDHVARARSSTPRRSPRSQRCPDEEDAGVKKVSLPYRLTQR